jgi:hypothetical protein
VRIEPESNDDLSMLIFECLIRYTFMETIILINTQIMVVRMNPFTASTGR